MAFASTQDNTNFARLCRLVVDVGCTVVRDTFDSIHPPANLHGVLSSPSVFSTLQSLKRNRILNPLQWGKLFPAVASTVSSANFDVTLLMVLLRNICGLSPPVSTGNWDELPPDSDNSTEANIVRIKCYRNEVYAHASEASVNNPTFDELWQKIGSAILALKPGANYTLYATAINQLKTECMDPVAEAHYKNLLNEWKKGDDSLKEMLEEVKGMQIGIFTGGYLKFCSPENAIIGGGGEKCMYVMVVHLISDKKKLKAYFLEVFYLKQILINALRFL